MSDDAQLMKKTEATAKRRLKWAIYVTFAVSVLTAVAFSGNASPSQGKVVGEATTGSVDGYVGRAYDALRSEKYELAVEEFRAALRLDPKLTLRARFPMAVALFEMKKLEEARAELGTVRREIKDYPNATYYLGRIELEEQHYENAIKYLNEVVAAPPLPDTAYYLGFAYFKQGDLASAEKWLKAAAEVTPQDSRVQYQLGQVYQRQKRVSEAKEAIARSSEQRRRNMNESQLRFECGKKLEQGPREEAYVVCDRLYDADDADQLTRLGTIYGQHGDAKAALKPLRRAAELAPHSPQMQYNLALDYYQLGQFEEARTPLSNAVSRWPDIFPLVALYGAVLSKLGEDLAAYQALRHAHEINAEDSATGDLLYLTTLSLGRKAEGGRQYTEALGYFREANKLKPQEPAPHRGIAEVFKLTGRSDQAASEEKEADRLASLLQKTQ